jgi:hypothetical protein
MLVGMVVAAMQGIVASDWHTLAWTPVVLVCASIASVLGSLLTPPDDEETLANFYRTVRPWGFWKPVHDRVVREEPRFEKNRNFWRDMLNILVGIVWQFQLVIIPLFLILQRWQALWISIGVFVITSAFLKVSWYDRLDREPQPAADR